MGVNRLLFRIDVSFPKYLLAIKIDEKNMLTETLFLRRKDKKHQKKNLVVKLLEFMSDADYEIGRIQPFINKFKNRKLKKKMKKN